MYILSLLGIGRRSYLCGMFLAGAAGLCSCATDLGTPLPDMEVAPPVVDGSVTGVSKVPLTPDMSGIKLDDGIYSAKLHKIIIPGAATGNLFLIDPDTLAVTTISGFAKPPAVPPTVPSGGVTSVTEGNGLLYASDQTDNKVYVVDPMAGSIVTSVALAAAPDYVRYVATTNELWVTEPDVTAQIEVLSLKVDPRKPKHTTVIKVAGGPEALYINNTAKVAYTNADSTKTVSIDLTRRTVKTTWVSGCMDGKGITADEPSGLVFVGCGEGGVAAVDSSQGKLVSNIGTSMKVDSFSFSPTLRHLYLPGSTMTIVGVTKLGTLSKLTEVSTPGGVSKHTLADDRGHAWDFKGDIGQLARIQDDQPASN